HAGQRAQRARDNRTSLEKGGQPAAVTEQGVDLCIGKNPADDLQYPFTSAHPQEPIMDDRDPHQRSCCRCFSGNSSSASTAARSMSSSASLSKPLPLDGVSSEGCGTSATFCGTSLCAVSRADSYTCQVSHAVFSISN